MKLLTTGGFLYSSVSAANKDGTSGSWQNFDYVAMFPEGANVNKATGNNINVGWDPFVTTILSTYDGGKIIAGFGKVTGVMYKPWVIKMWGTSGTTPCSNDSKITGYVTMKVGLSEEQTTATDCALTADAKVQWAWNGMATTGLQSTAGTDRSSYIILTASEDTTTGGTASTDPGADPYIIIAGATTSFTNVMWGMNGWSTFGAFIDVDGLTAAASVGSEIAGAD